MKATSLKLAALCAASLLASATAQAETTVDTYRNAFSTAETFTFSTMVEGSTYVWIGSAATDNPFEEDWAVWVSQDGTENCGIKQTADYMRIADAANQKGRLRIESGAYSTQYFRVGVGGGKGYLTMEGGTLTINNSSNSSGGLWVGAGDGGVGEFKQTGGAVKLVNNNWAAIGVDNANDTGTYELSGTATFEMYDSGDNGALVIGRNGTGTVTVKDSATVSVRRINFGEASTGYGTLNLDGGAVSLRWFELGTSGGTGTINFNGGTLVAKQSYASFIPGSIAVTVGEDGGTIDTQGFNVTVVPAISGTGVLTITGGGTVTFSSAPTCGLNVEEGIAVLPTGATPASLEFGTNGFVKFDLSSVSATTVEEATTLPDSQTLATVASIAVPDGETVAEHVIIKNDAVGGSGGHTATVLWIASYEGTVLTAKAQATTSTPDTTVWVGGYTTWYTPWIGSYNARWSDAANWVSGLPGASSTAIVPSATDIYLDGSTHNCGTLELRTTGTVRIWNQSKDNSYTTFRPTSVTGSGTLQLGGIWVSAASGGPSIVIDVPVVAELTGHRDGTYAGELKLQGNANYSVTLGRTLTVPAGVLCEVQDNVIINGDMVIDGTNTFATVQEIKAGLSGSGVIAGSFTTAAGAVLTSTITDANGTAECLTVTGNADLSNADVEILGGDLVANAAVGTEIILLKASGTITWSKKSYVIPGQSKTWTIKTDTWTDEDTGTIYNVLKAAKAKSGLVIIFL